jgi:hypothetical protein
VETQNTVVYNAPDGEAFVALIEGRSSGGLAQLGEHYVRNVGVGGSTPLPSTTVLNQHFLGESPRITSSLAGRILAPERRLSETISPDTHRANRLVRCKRSRQKLFL